MREFLLLTGDAATQEGIPTGGIFTMLIPILLVFVVFYFFLIRPEKKRKKEINEMRDNLKVGNEIVTIGGIVGKITNIKDDKITIETGADRNKMRIMRWAISSVEDKDKEKDSAKEDSKPELEEKSEEQDSKEK